jgi:hypothetical protein
LHHHGGVPVFLAILSNSRRIGIIQDGEEPAWLHSNAAIAASAGHKNGPRKLPVKILKFYIKILLEKCGFLFCQLFQSRILISVFDSLSAARRLVSPRQVAAA